MGGKLSKLSRSRPRPEVTIQQLLNEFSESLIPPPFYYTQADNIIDQVFDLIKKNRRDVSRCFVGGGIGKQTAVRGCEDDYELVVFLNNQTLSSLPKVIEKTEALFKAARYGPVDVMNETTIRFYPMTGLKFYLSFAFNTTSYLHTYVQRRGVYLLISEMENPSEDSHIFNPSLSEGSSKFVKTQTPFVRSVIRLAKHWIKNLNLGGNDFFPGRNLLVEVIAIQACKEVGTWTLDIYLAFKKFLEIVKDFDKMRFYFTRYYSDSWLWEHIPRTVMLSTPLVLHPTNPYHNLADIRIHQKHEFSNHAKKVLENLEKLKEKIDSKTVKVENIEIEFIFQKKVERSYWMDRGESLDSDSDD